MFYSVVPERHLKGGEEALIQKPPTPSQPSTTVVLGTLATLGVMPNVGWMLALSDEGVHPNKY
jgi:hypothetical protein